jgi:hypothetical protein
VELWRTLCWFVLLAVLPRHALAAASAQSGSIRGVVRDSDFGAPLAAAQVMIVETGQRTSTTDQGNFVFGQVAPGRYTLVFTKDGYTRQVRADIVVSPGQLTDLDVALVGEYTEMEEFVVQDMLQLGAGSEAALLKLRFQSPALMDSIGADLISRAGASDAAAALRYVAGASVADNNSAVIRGLPDRYISSQMNGVVLPTADSDKRAVQLDQFPAPVIESIQVSKTFTPDEPGDASGGAVNVRLKSIPSEGIFQVKGQLGFNTRESATTSSSRIRAAASTSGGSTTAAATCSSITWATTGPAPRARAQQAHHKTTSGRSWPAASARSTTA